MIAIGASALEKVIVGNDAGWHLAFEKRIAPATTGAPVLSIGSSDYYAAIDATLPGDLTAGTYKFELEGLTDQHYASLRAGMRGEGRQKVTLVAKLYLYWRDTAASAGGYFSSALGITDLRDSRPPDDPWLVAVLAVTKVQRTAGVHRYTTTIEARELVFHQLATPPSVAADLDLSSPLRAAYRLARDRQVTITVPTTEPQADAGGNNDTSQARPGLQRGRNAAQALTTIGTRIEQAQRARNRYGRGMFLIRNGTLAMGPDRPIPAVEGDPKRLWFKSGLVEYSSDGSVQVDPNRTAADEGQTSGPAHPTRKKYKLTLKGRPDIKPGDIVKFLPEAQDIDTANAFGSYYEGFKLPIGMPEPNWSRGDIVQLYVSGVRHQMSRTIPFMTEVSGVEVWDGDRWDTRTADEEGNAVSRLDPAASEVNAAISALDERVRRAGSNVRTAEIGEVRAFHPTANGNPTQTEDVFRGLADADGRPNQARRLEVQRAAPTEKTGVGIATPFAFGKAGLVLPRYPGTRVVLVHRNGDAEDPIDIGALWRSPDAPPSHAGDYWLILPSEVAADRREHIPTSDTPTPYAGKASNDLIDADGNRVIQVGNLTLRFGADALVDAGTRPEVSTRGLLTIEHASKNARIVIDDDGTVTIEAAKNIVMKAPQGKINLEAQEVNVTVDTVMNVAKS